MLLDENKEYKYKLVKTFHPEKWLQDLCVTDAACENLKRTSP